MSAWRWVWHAFFFAWSAACLAVAEQNRHSAGSVNGRSPFAGGEA